MTDNWRDTLWQLATKARQSATDRELGFLWANETVALTPYRQSAIWLKDQGVWCLSGVVQVDANVPYALWLKAVFEHFKHLPQGTHSFTAQDLPADLAAQWKDWWPAHALWVSPQPKHGQTMAGIVAKEEPWTDAEQQALEEWTGIWHHAFEALYRPKRKLLKTYWPQAAAWWTWSAERPWHKQRRVWALAALLAVLLWPVRQTVMAPGELVPANPIVVRAPLDGTIDTFHVQPNQTVEANEPLFSFDEIVIQSRLAVAQQAWNTAQTDYRQTSQMALTDPKAKAQLGLLIGKIDEREAEIHFLQEQLARTRVLAPQAGVVLMDDPSEWLGRPVSTGERILRIATLQDIEVEVWLPLADAIRLQTGSPVVLYLSSSPLSPIDAQVRYVALEAVMRPEGQFAYRVRASLTEPTKHRVGLKGSAKVNGGWVPLSYWVLRRPLATARAYIGW